MQTPKSHIRILSWDCAYKTLGWAIISVNCNIEQDVVDCAQKLLAATSVEAQFAAAIEYKNTITNWFRIESLGVDDILPGKLLAEVNSVERARALHRYLTTAAHLHDLIPDIVLIEGQPAALSG